MLLLSVKRWKTFFQSLHYETAQQFRAGNSGFSLSLDPAPGARRYKCLTIIVRRQRNSANPVVFMTVRLRAISTWTVCLFFGVSALAAEPYEDHAAQLVGRWQSFSLISTNFDVFAKATNVILCVHQVGWVTNSVTRQPEPEIDAELWAGGAGGRELLCEGPARASERMIVIGSSSRVGFPYRLTNGVLVLERPGADYSFHVRLKRVASDMGKGIP